MKRYLLCQRRDSGGISRRWAVYQTLQRPFRGTDNLTEFSSWRLESGNFWSPDRVLPKKKKIVKESESGTFSTLLLYTIPTFGTDGSFSESGATRTHPSNSRCRRLHRRHFKTCPSLSSQLPRRPTNSTSCPHLSCLPSRILTPLPNPFQFMLILVGRLSNTHNMNRRYGDSLLKELPLLITEVTKLESSMPLQRACRDSH